MISEDLFFIIPIEPQNVKGSMIGGARIGGIVLGNFAVKQFGIATCSTAYGDEPAVWNVEKGGKAAAAGVKLVAEIG